jgi:dTMP kinase
MLLLLPFIENLLGLVLISFALEILTLLWGPAKDASVPRRVRPAHLGEHLVARRELRDVPVGVDRVLPLLAAVAAWLGSFSALSALRVDQEALALAVDACTFLVSALIVFRLPIPRGDGRESRHTDLGRRCATSAKVCASSRGSPGCGASSSAWGSA